MEKRHILAMTSVVSSILWFWAVCAFNEWGAQWWDCSIWIFAVLFAALFVGIAVGLRLLSIDDSTPKLVLIGLAIFVALSLAEGVFFSEPSLQQQQNQPHHAVASSDDSSHSSFFYYWHESTTSSSSSHSSSSNSKDAGYILLILLLIALLLGSAFIAHFWVVAVCIGILLLWCFTIKEYRRAADPYYT